MMQGFLSDEPENGVVWGFSQAEIDEQVVKQDIWASNHQSQ